MKEERSKTKKIKQEESGTQHNNQASFITFLICATKNTKLQMRKYKISCLSNSDRRLKAKKTLTGKLPE